MYEMRPSPRGTKNWEVYAENGECVQIGDYESCVECMNLHNTEYDSNLDWRGYAEEETDGYGY